MEEGGDVFVGGGESGSEGLEVAVEKEGGRGAEEDVPALVG